MNDPVSHIEASARLDAVGVDMRSRLRFERMPLHVRPELTQRIARLLSEGNSVLLRGAPGVGKTALAYGLAIADWPSSAPGQLHLVETNPKPGPGMLEVTTARLLAGAYWVNQLEGKCELVFETARTKQIVLFIDNAHTLVGAGSSVSDPTGDIAHLIIPHLERGLRVVAATTPEGEARLRSGNEQLYRRFVVVDVPEPDAEETAGIVRAHIEALRRSGIEIGASDAEAGLNIARRHLPGTPAYAGMLRLLRRLEPGERATPERLRRAAASELGLAPWLVRAAACRTRDELTAILSAEVFGQDEAVGEVTDALLRFSTGLAEEGRPAASFLFAGPSGCGKTSLARAAARLVSGSDAGPIRFDMSEYADPGAAARLIADSAASLTAAVRARPAGVVLFDEIEKAHPVVGRLLLQVLGEARLTDEAGRSVRFDNHFVVMTSNVGASRWSFLRDGADPTPLVLADCALVFPPEFLARLTRTVVFRPLSRGAIERVVLRELDRLNEAPGLADRGLQLVWGDGLAGAVAGCVDAGHRGARGVQTAVRSIVASPLARWLSEHPAAADGLVLVTPRLEAGELASLVIDWTDESGFFRELVN